jgi:MYXO-CTERM domain-containing protein
MVSDAGVSDDAPVVIDKDVPATMDGSPSVLDTAPACNCRVPGGAPTGGGRGALAAFGLAALALVRRRRVSRSTAR